MLCSEQSEGRFHKRGICMKIAGRRSVICRAAHKQQTSHAAAAEFYVCTPTFSAGPKDKKFLRFAVNYSWDVYDTEMIPSDPEKKL